MRSGFHALPEKAFKHSFPLSKTLNKLYKKRLGRADQPNVPNRGSAVLEGYGTLPSRQSCGNTLLRKMANGVAPDIL
jgi:hypothetical protein